MAIDIDKQICNGCGQCEVSKCMEVCPGNLLYKNKNNKAEIRDKADCWDCAACVKACPQQAIKLYLPPEIGGRGSKLYAQDLGEKIIWTLEKTDGTVEKYKIQNKLHFNLNL